MFTSTTDRTRFTRCTAMFVSALTAGAIFAASTGAHAAEVTPHTTAAVSVAPDEAGRRPAPGARRRQGSLPLTPIGDIDMPAANIVFACETLLVVTGIIWMLAVVRTRARVAGADRPRLGLIQPTGELITAAALSLGAGWAVTRHEVPNLLVLANLGIALPAMAAGLAPHLF
ncbi:hypothetical protein ACH4OQ_22245 [Streptomyces luteogriseus]|uniref:hypothetical protein n=1 Tax=Streptomyces luteogriseus TaxID=68233 RepID=UPI0037BDBB22